jgi:tRNA A-37 threonylcarbamoyl transferase component Bud32
MAATFIKVFSLNKVPIENIENEIMFQKIASDYDFTPKILKAWKENENFFIEMEKIDAPCLAEKYGDDPDDIPVEYWNKMREILQILWEVEGIEYVDITPYNFIEKDGKLFLIDFGHARWKSRNGEMNWFLKEFLDPNEAIQMYNPDFR